LTTNNAVPKNRFAFQHIYYHRRDPSRAVPWRERGAAATKAGVVCASEPGAGAPRGGDVTAQARVTTAKLFRRVLPASGSHLQAAPCRHCSALRSRARSIARSSRRRSIVSFGTELLLDLVYA